MSGADDPKASRGHVSRVAALEALQRRYQLTPAELRIADLIADGRAPREIAETAGISVLTVRAHLRSLYEKTGVRRQTALARLVWEGKTPK